LPDAQAPKTLGAQKTDGCRWEADDRRLNTAASLLPKSLDVGFAANGGS